MSDDQRLAQLVRENQRLRQELYECRNMLRSIFVRNLIEDSVNPVHTSNLSSQLEKNGVQLPWADLMICTLEVIGVGRTDAQHPSSHEEFNRMRDTVLLVCEGMLNVRHICYSADAGNEILLLINFQQPQEHPFTDQMMVEEVAGIMSKAVDYLESSYSILIAAAVSQPTRSLRDLTRIWQESRALFEETSNYARSRVLTSYDVTASDTTERYRTYNDRLFYNAVLTGDFPQARALTDAYIESFAQSDNALWELKPPLKKRLRTAASLFPGGRGQHDFQVGARDRQPGVPVQNLWNSWKRCWIISSSPWHLRPQHRRSVPIPSGGIFRRILRIGNWALSCSAGSLDTVPHISAIYIR